MDIMRRETLSFMLKFAFPAVIVGVILLPNISIAILKHSEHKFRSVEHPTLEERLVFSEIIDVPASKPVKVKLPKDVAKGLGLLSLEIKLPKSMKLIVNVSEVLNPPPPLEEFLLISIFDITFRDAETGEIVEPSGRIYFSVSKDFFESTKFDPKKVVMLKFRGDWIRLRTEMLGEDNGSYYYVAETKSFSVFAIAVYRIASENCSECHPDVATELSMSPYHNFNCTFCHPGMSRNVTCVQCHFDIGSFSAHKNFIEWAENNSLMMGSNEACIGCHTNAKIPIYNVTERTHLSFTFDMAELHGR